MLTPVPFGSPVPQADALTVRLRDGVRLATDVYLPPSPGRSPTVLIRTPYDKTRPTGLLPEIADRLTDAGYAVVVQDVRGKVRSEGRAVPFVNELADGWDTLVWITAQPWSNGAVGCWGNSYYGFTARAAAASGHPAVRALAVRLTSADIGGSGSGSGGSGVGSEVGEFTHRNGVFRFGPMVEWLSTTWAGPANLDGAIDWSLPPHQLLAGLPRLAVDLGADLGVDFPGHGRVPTLHCTGWYDLFQAGQLADWRRAVGSARGRAPQYLVASAGDHMDDLFTRDGRSPDHLTDKTAREAMLDRTLAPVVAFFDRHLRGRDDRLDSVPVPPVRWECAGAGWHAGSEWPPAGAVPVRLHLVARGALRSVPNPQSQNTCWEHDPADPVPVTDADWWRPLLALPDERAVESRPDVLTFTGPPLAAPLCLAGPVRLALPLSVGPASGHVVAKLCAVAPDGTSRRILEAPQPVTRTDGAYAPVTVPLGDTGHLLPAGHRLRVQLATSCYPSYLPGPAGRFALRTGGHDGAHLDLTVLPGALT
ncbi:CocE/NonD family hydrolase [Streptacidiphilus fuscans]|nr:CocE/NonD family hydrolase [Streptacidiphilus fuscans]